MSSHPICVRSSFIDLNVDRSPSSFEDNQKIRLSILVDNVNNNNLNLFYSNNESLFKKRIDKLNLKFYIETEKYLSNNNDMQKCQDNLFIILFKQISLYIEEIERLNCLLKEKRDDQKTTKEKLEEINQRQKELTATKVLVEALKSSNALVEKKLQEKSQAMEKIQQENESLRRQNKFYKEKLQYDLAYKKFHIDPGIASSLVCGKSAEQNAKDFNNNVSTCQNESITSFISSSKDSSLKKADAIINSNCNNNSKKQPNEIMIFEKLQVQNPPSLNTNESLNLKKIINKKRNYSDNNPSQIKKIHFEINPNVGNIARNLNNRNNSGFSVENVKTNSNSKGSTNSNHKIALTGSKKNIAGQKDLKIIKLVKQQIAAKRGNNLEEKKDTKEKELLSDNGILNDQHSVIQTQRQGSEIDQKESYLLNYLALNSEIIELTELEALLNDIKSKFCNGEDDSVGNSFEKSTKKKENFLSDAEDLEGYKSSTSCVSEKQFAACQDASIEKRIEKSSNKYPVQTSITIDLIGKASSNTDTEKEPKEKEVKNSKRPGIGILSITPTFGKLKRK